MSTAATTSSIELSRAELKARVERSTPTRELRDRRKVKSHCAETTINQEADQGERPMMIRCEASDPVVSDEALAEMVKRIRKLRWIGMDEEAKALELELKCMPAGNKSSVLAEQYCTD
jgi:hypothetical protein